MTVAATLKKLKERADSFRENRPVIGPGNPIEFPEAASEFDAIWQGDVGFVVVGEVPEGFTLLEKEKKFAQMAHGNTKGSQHILENLGDVDMYLPETWDEPESLVGPCLVVKEKTRVNHPEHGSVTLQAGTNYLCVFSLNLDVANMIERRARD